MKKLVYPLFLVLLLLMLDPSAAEAEIFAGPVRARLIRVIDGDTLLVEVSPWFGQRIEVAVRLEGIDAPELQSRCPLERHLAAKARVYLQTRVGAELSLHDVRKGKYFGRVIARVETDKGEDLSYLLLKKNLAHPYDGRAKKAHKCPLK